MRLMRKLKKLTYRAMITGTLLLFIYVYLLPKTILYTYTVKNQDIKYILIWTDPNYAPSYYLHHGFDAFIENNCEYTNCYVSHAHVLSIGSLYDVVVFNGRLLPVSWPSTRSPEQKYVFVNMESAQNCPVYNRWLKGHFNWTWTYKLNSEVPWTYFTIYDLTGQPVGPKIDMHWRKMDPVNKQTKARLSFKTIAAAWFVSNCKTKNKREKFVKYLVKDLYLHDLSLHVYGLCGEYECPRNNEECDKLLENKYYFYLAFENSFSEDYVTEKVFRALNSYTVPVVFGGANYSRFLPPGSYLDARELGPKRLAAKMAAIIEDHQKSGSLYYDFFRWRNHYTFKCEPFKKPVCDICKLLNDPVAMSETTVYENFEKWWNGNTT